MDKALIAFSFDDGRLDNYTNAYPILKKYHLPATFNITTGYINNNINREEFEFPQPMTPQMVKELYNDGDYEIAGHGCQHTNTSDDIVKGIHDLHLLLNTNQLTDKGNGFASPGSDLTKDMYKEMKPVLDLYQINYVRVSCRYKSFKILKVICRKVSRIIKHPLLYRIAYQDTLMSSIEDNVLFSIPVLASATPTQIESIIKLTIKKKQSCILMFHSIVNKKAINNTWDYSSDAFDELCKKLSAYKNKNQIEIMTVMDVYSSLSK